MSVIFFHIRVSHFSTGYHTLTGLHLTIYQWLCRLAIQWVSSIAEIHASHENKKKTKHRHTPYLFVDSTCFFCMPVYMCVYINFEPDLAPVRPSRITHGPACYVSGPDLMKWTWSFQNWTDAGYVTNLGTTRNFFFFLSHASHVPCPDHSASITI